MTNGKKTAYMAMPLPENLEGMPVCSKPKNKKFRHGQMRALIYGKYKRANWCLVALYKYLTNSYAEIERHADAHYRNEHLGTRKMLARHLRKKGINPNRFFKQWGM